MISLDAAADTRRALQERFERRLVRRVLDDGLLASEAVEEALEQQVVLGGHLATALYELGLLDAVTLTRLSADVLGIRPADVRKVAAAPAGVRRLLPRALVERARLLPFAVEGRTLHLATAEPWDVAALEAASHASGRRVEAVFLAEVPLTRMLQRLYGVPLPARFELLPVLRRQRMARATGEAEGPEGPGGGELISQAEFEALYGRLGDATAAPGGDDEAPGPEAPGTPDPEAAEEEILELGAEEEVAPPEPILELADALARLDAATDRAAVGDVLARFALSKGRRAALLVHHRGVWTGWAAAGEDVPAGAARALALPAAEGSILGVVSRMGSPVLGPLAEHPVNERLIEALGGGWPRSVGLFPVHWRSRVVFGIYLDGGEDADVATDVAEILVLAQRVAAILARLVDRRLGR